MNGDDQEGGDDVMACERHEIASLPSGYDTCPLCTEEQRIEGERVHRATRDPTMEPW